MGERSDETQDQRAADAVLALLNAQTWISSRQVMRDHKAELLTPAADAAFQELIDENRANADAISFLEHRRRVVARVKEAGVDAAYAELITADYVSSLVEELKTLSPGEPRRVDVARALLAIADQGDASWRAGLQVELARSLLIMPAGSQNSHVPEAIDLLGEAASLYEREGRRDHRADALYLEATAFMRRGSGDRATDLAAAAKCAGEAADLWRASNKREPLASALHVLGSAALERATDASLSDAARYFREAIAVLGSVEADGVRGRVELALGDTLARAHGVLDAPGGDDAIGHYEAALRLWSKENPQLGRSIAERIVALRLERAKHPSDETAAIDDLTRAAELRVRDDNPPKWAQLQHNLAESLRVRTGGDRADNIERAIEHFSKALEVFTAEAFPVDFGLAANSIGAAYLARRVGDHGENIERAIGFLTAALAVRPREKFPDYWGKTQVNLGSAFLTRVKAERADNLSRAIEHLEAALQATDVRWIAAMRPTLESQLARTYFARADEAGGGEPDRAEAAAHAQSALDLLGADSTEPPAGDAHRVLGLLLAGKQNPEDSERAIVHLERAVAAGANADQPFESAKTHETLGHQYEFRAAGDAPENLRQAVKHYQAARLTYASAKATLAVALCDYWIGEVTLKRGDLTPVQRLADALDRLRAAINQYPTDGPGELLADMHLAIGDALADLTSGDRGKTFEDAIAHYRLALASLGDGDRGRRSRAHSAIGVALYEWRGGSRFANLEEAIVHQQAVLGIVTRDLDQDSWALAHHNLGNAYSERPLGSRAENLDAAIGHFEQALTVMTRERVPEDWAMVNNSLANTYMLRLRGDRAYNMEHAIELLTGALSVYTRERFPADWAMTLHNLGSAWSQRIEGYPAENIEKAIDAFTQSLVIRTRAALPFYWAMTQMNLGTAYSARQYGDRQENGRESARHYQLALEVYTRDATPTSWAGAQAMLGGCDGISLDERIACYTAALEVFTKDGDPVTWALTQNNLALRYREKAREDPSYAGAAITHLEQALEVLTPETAPSQCRTTRANLGNEYFLQHDWATALGWYEQASAVAEKMLEDAYTEEGRLNESSEAGDLHTHAAYCLLQLGRVEDALVRLDAGKTRHLAESLARSGADLAALPQDLGSRLRSLRDTVRLLQAESRIRDEDLPPPAVELREALRPASTPQARLPSPPVGLNLHDARIAMQSYGLTVRLDTPMKDAMDALNDAVREARTIDPAFMRPGIAAKDIAGLVPADGALVVFALTHAGSAAWVVPSGVAQIGPEHVVHLADAAPQSLVGLLNGTPNTRSWLHATRDAEQELDLQAWQQTAESVTRSLWDVVVQPIHERFQALGLAHDAPIVVVPNAHLALLPLHAAWREVDGAARALLDDHPITYAPSLYALRVALRRAAAVTVGGRLLAVVNPTGDLPFTVAEGEGAAAHFEADRVHMLPGAAATEPVVVKGIAGSGYVHFATHGLYDWRDPMRSHLALAGGTRLTLGRVVSPEVDLSATRLVVLSACDSGLVDFEKVPDEFLGLPAAFIEGGAAGVLSAQWAINDMSTSVLVEEFYRRHVVGGEDIASALRGAQRWLRDSTAAELRLAERWEARYANTQPPDGYAFRMKRYWQTNPTLVPYASPYYWAAFTFHGA